MKTISVALVVVVVAIVVVLAGPDKMCCTVPTQSLPLSRPQRRMRRLFRIGKGGGGTRRPLTASEACKAFEPLFDVDTPADQLPGLIRDLAARCDKCVAYRLAARRTTTVADAILLGDRIRDGPYSRDDQVRLLRLLATKISPGAFFPVVASDMVRVGDDADRVVQARYPLDLLADLPYLDLVGRLPDDPLPDDIVEEVWAVADDLAGLDWMSAPDGYDPVDVQRVRGQFPAPFHLVFPFNEAYARRLLPELAQLAPGGERRRTVAALAQFGVRLDLVDVLDLGLDPDDPDLPWLLAFADPRRTPFDGLRYDADHGGSLGAACAQDIPAPVAARLERHRPYLPVLYRTPAFRALLRRRPDQFTAAVARLPPAETYPPLAAQPFLAYPEFAELANLLFRELIVAQLSGAGGMDSASLDALRQLVVLPRVDLYRSLPEGSSVLGYLCQFRELFEALLCSPELLGRLFADPDGFARYLDRAAEFDRVLVRDFLDHFAQRHILVGQIRDRLGKREARGIFGSLRESQLSSSLLALS